MKKLMMAAMMAAAMAATADEWGFTYQAELRDDKGAVLPTRNHTVEIRLWDAPTGGSTPLWGRFYNVETDANGLFNVALSDDDGSPVDEFTGVTAPKLADVLKSRLAGGVYAGLTVQGSAGEIVPRQRIYAVPFAGTANAARSLVGDNVSVAGTLNLDGNTSFSKSGIKLADNSSSTMGTVNAQNVTVEELKANGGVTTTDIAFSGTLKQKGTEVIPVPVGGIILWTKADLPDNEHWAVCDGTTKNGVTTPDLRGRFVVGVDSRDADYNKASRTGGEKTHKLSTDEMPAHRHNYLADQILRLSAKNSHGNVPYESAMCDLNAAPNVKVSYNADENGRYVQEFGTSSTGSSAAHENRPPYYALYYIMRVK